MKWSMLSRLTLVSGLSLLILSVSTHLVSLSFPREVIFDEVHFGKFITAYCCTGHRFFDIHPPHTKLLIAGASWLAGYRGGFTFDHIGQPYVDVPVAALRIVPALAGIILPIIFYSLLRQLGLSQPTALLGGLIIVFDNALTVQTRIIALDGVLLVATVGSLSAYLAMRKSQGRRRFAFACLVGGLAGLALGTKFTGLAAGALIGVLSVVELSRLRSWVTIRPVLVTWVLMAGSALVVYLAGWALHFALLPLAGSGDAFRVPQIVTDQGPVQLMSTFIRETVALHKVMFQANYNLSATHPDASPWWSWPLMQTTVFYWQGLGGRAIYFLGNPAVWWGSSVSLILFLGNVLFNSGQRRSLWHAAWIPVVGFIIALLPLVRVPRALFLYHYLTPLLFAVMISLMWLEHQRWYNVRLHPGSIPMGVLIISTVVIIMFGWFSPLTYGLAVPDTFRNGLFWLNSWH